ISTNRLKQILTVLQRANWNIGKKWIQEQDLCKYVLGFEGWTTEHFAKVDRHTRSKLRDHLIVNGVYMTSIGKLNKRLIAEQLMEPLQAKTYHIFTEENEREWSDKRDLPISEPSFGQKVQ
ncbi:hypothetical protein GcM1_020001, partial [Golovinomyces cichoracearum]